MVSKFDIYQSIADKENGLVNIKWIRFISIFLSYIFAVAYMFAVANIVAVAMMGQETVVTQRNHNFEISTYSF